MINPLGAKPIRVRDGCEVPRSPCGAPQAPGRGGGSGLVSFTPGSLSWASPKSTASSAAALSPTAPGMPTASPGCPQGVGKEWECCWCPAANP